jgi:uncharacterized protein
VLCAVAIDVSRLAVYGVTLFSKQLAALQSQGIAGLVVAGSLAAFLGAFIGKRRLKKVTMRGIQVTVGVMLLLLAVALGMGLV